MNIIGKYWEVSLEMHWEGGQRFPSLSPGNGSRQSWVFLGCRHSTGIKISKLFTSCYSATSVFWKSRKISFFSCFLHLIPLLLPFCSVLLILELHIFWIMCLPDCQHPAHMLHTYLTVINWSEIWIPNLSKKKKKCLAYMKRKYSSKCLSTWIVGRTWSLMRCQALC